MACSKVEARGHLLHKTGGRELHECIASKIVTERKMFYYNNLYKNVRNNPRVTLSKQVCSA